MINKTKLNKKLLLFTIRRICKQPQFSMNFRNKLFSSIYLRRSRRI